MVYVWGELTFIFKIKFVLCVPINIDLKIDLYANIEYANIKLNK